MEIKDNFQDCIKNNEKSNNQFGHLGYIRHMI